MSVAVGAPSAPIHGLALCSVLPVVLVLVTYCDCVFLGNIVLNAFGDVLNLSCFTRGYKTPELGNVLHHYCSHYSNSGTDLI